MDDFLKALGLLIFFILSNWLKDEVERRKKKRAEQEQKMKSDLQFTTLLHEQVKNKEYELMSEYQSHRMFVFHFRNGDFTDAGVSIKKIYCMHEIRSLSSVKYMNDHYQGSMVPEMFYHAFDEVRKNGHYYVASKEDVDDNQPMQDWMDLWSIGSFLFVALRKDGVAKSVLVMNFPRPEHLNKNRINEIKRDRVSIEKIYQSL